MCIPWAHSTANLVLWSVTGGYVTVGVQTDMASHYNYCDSKECKITVLPVIDASV